MQQTINPLIDSRFSGGGNNFLKNVQLARERFPDHFNDQGIPIILKNVVPMDVARSGKYIYIPQNAWAWVGPVADMQEFGRRSMLKICSIVGHKRAQKVIRIGPMIPERGVCESEYLENVLDTSFEQEVNNIPSTGRPTWLPANDFFFAPGSLLAYRNLEMLLVAYEDYRDQNGNGPDLVILGPAFSGKYLSRLQKAAARLDGVRIVSNFVARVEILYALSKSTMTIFPSLVEASPVTLLEASALGKVNIAMDQPGHRHIIDAADLNNFHLFSSRESLTARMTSIPGPQTGSLSEESARASARETWIAKFLTMTTRVSQVSQDD